MQEAVSILLLVSAVLSSAATSKPQQKSKSGAAVEPNDKAASAQMHVMTTSASEAMSGCMERVCRPAMAGHVGSTTAVALLHDLAVFMQLGRSATVLALNDVQRLFDASIVDLPAVANDRIAKDTDVVDQAKHQHVQKHLKRVRAQYLMVQHKVGFMLAWANELSDLTYNGLHDAVLNEMHEHEVPQAKEPNSLFNLQPESYVGSILQSDKLSLQQKPKIQTL